ncbi:hypothetical protein AOLI_G00012290 [Acnodon oligacanthus]
MKMENDDAEAIDELMHINLDDTETHDDRSFALKDLIEITLEDPEEEPVEEPEEEPLAIPLGFPKVYTTLTPFFELQHLHCTQSDLKPSVRTLRLVISPRRGQVRESAVEVKDDFVARRWRERVLVGNDEAIHSSREISVVWRNRATCPLAAWANK